MYENMDMQELIQRAENGDEEAMLMLARGLLSGSGDIEDRNPEVIELGMKYLKSAIKLGNADAMNEMGCMYYCGNLVEQSYKKAAAAGSVDAMNNLGYCYYYGRDTAVDMKKAYIYYSQAAFFGNPQAYYKLGDMYMNGYFVKTDEKMGFELYFRAYKMSQNDVDSADGQETYSGACLRLARCLYEGVGVDRNLEEAGHIIADGIYYFRKRWQRHDEFCAGGFAEAKELQKKIQDELDAQDEGGVLID